VTGVVKPACNEYLAIVEEHRRADLVFFNHAASWNESVGGWIVNLRAVCTEPGGHQDRAVPEQRGGVIIPRRIHIGGEGESAGGGIVELGRGNCCVIGGDAASDQNFS